ncbi:ectomycorrhiza-regulated esterase [Guyanagaster necrorhizus]|uniref:Ectomycorrhiza-regulated esterase n=1 Tax=Guyanagaster necrorhizus TaxID=856835 RepID=A0A9P8ANI2_9AGAR|nr:ectomycorrhiza-regulated esterase [Guyanagaster necrorhizus MCA 3950]KAG7441874.1 ectomycorrhiza-regulated esterase [Guyanagaster necrorhizus MCA 3950]
MSGRISSNVFVPSPYAGEPSSIAGVLEQSEPGKSTHGRKLALILHGSGGHKDYLFFRKLATTLPMDTFRFDFRGHFESPGIWRQNSLEQDVLDLHVVTEYLTTYFGYHIDLIVAHSRGTILAVRWLCTTEEGKNVSGFVNVAGRYRIRVNEDETKEWNESFAAQGYHLLNLKAFKIKVYPEDIDTFANFDGSLVESRFPQRTDVLTIHGMLDRTVPVYEAVLYAKTLSKRYPGTHSLHLMENMDHNCTGRYDEVVRTIFDWWDGQLKGKLQSGVWKGTEDAKGKL